MRNVFGISLCALCLCGQLIVAGCRQAQVKEPLPAELMKNDPDAEIDFWHALTAQPVCSNDAAFHGLLLYLDDKDESPDYTTRVGSLKARGLLPPNFNQASDLAIQRGVLAVALCRALQIKGGVTLRVLPYSERYASRELQFMGLYPPGGTYQTFTGNEYVGIMGRLEDYQRGNAADKPASELQGHGEPATQPSDPAQPPQPAGG